MPSMPSYYFPHLHNRKQRVAVGIGLFVGVIIAVILRAPASSSDSNGLRGNNNTNGSSNNNSNETETETETRTRTDNHHVPTDAATRAALLSCCQVHENLRSISAAFPFFPPQSPLKRQDQKEYSSSSSSALRSASKSGAFFLSYIDPQSPSASLHDIFDLSPLASCLYENQVRGLSKSCHNDDYDSDDYDSGDDSDGQPAACYKTLYRRPGKTTRKPPEQDWDVYVLRTIECMRDMIQWVENAHDKNDGSDSDSFTRSYTLRPPPPLSATRIEQGTKTKAKGPNQKLLRPLIDAANLLANDTTRFIYGQWIQPHVESANEWAGKYAERCVREKIDKIRKQREKAQMEKEEEKRGREAMNGSGYPGWMSSGYARVRASLGFGGGGEDSARKEEEEEKKKKTEMRIEQLARRRCHDKWYGDRERVVALWTKFRKLPGNVDRERVCDDLAVAMATETASTEGIINDGSSNNGSSDNSDSDSYW